MERREADGKQTGEAGEIVSLPGLNLDATRRLVESLLRDGLDPPLTLFEIHPIPRPAGDPCLLLRVQRSWSPTTRTVDVGATGMSRQGGAIALKERPVYKQHRIHTRQLPSGPWLASIVSVGKRETITENSLTETVTRIPREYDSEEEAIQAARDYIDQQTKQKSEA